MKKILYYLVLCLPLLAVQCEDEPISGELKLRIVPKYGDKTFVMYEDVVSAQGFPLKMKRFSLFLQVQNGDAVAKTGYEDLVFIDLANLTDKAKAEEGFVASFDLAAGTYNALDLGIGVPSSLNQKKPTDFKLGNPLREASEYWESWDSYIFTKTEGALDTTKTGKADLNFSYHTGTDEMFRNISLPKSFTISEAKTTEIVLELDVKELLNGKAGVVNPLKNQNAHSLSNKTVALIISDNYKTAFKVR